MEALILALLFAAFLTANILAIKNKKIGRHIILGLSIVGIVSALNINLQAFDSDLVIAAFFITAFFSMLSLLILVPNNAKYNGKNSGLWAFLTLIAGPIAALIYYVFTYIKKEN